MQSRARVWLPPGTSHVIGTGSRNCRHLVYCIVVRLAGRRVLIVVFGWLTEMCGLGVECKASRFECGMSGRLLAASIHGHSPACSGRRLLVDGVDFVAIVCGALARLPHPLACLVSACDRRGVAVWWSPATNVLESFRYLPVAAMYDSWGNICTHGALQSWRHEERLS